MTKKTVITAFSILSLTGAFLPIASKGNIYIYIYQLKGSSSLLYVISVALIVFSIANLLRKIEDAKLLFITSSLFGLTILIYSTAESINAIDHTTQENTEFENRTNEFLKEFKESRKEADQRQKEMEEKLNKIWKNIETIKENKTHQENIQTPPNNPATNIGLGAYLMALGFLGVLTFSCLPERKNKQSAAL